MFNFLRPKDALSDADRARNSAVMMRQIFASSGADGFVSGGFLAAFALLIGASNLHIGIMTAIPFIMQPLQLFSVVLIERLRVRKPLALVAYSLNFAAWGADRTDAIRFGSAERGSGSFAARFCRASRGRHSTVRF